MLRKHKNLWCDLAFRSDHASGGKVDPAWRAVFLEFPDRFMVGTDTFTPERWHYVAEHADWSRGWLADLPATSPSASHGKTARRCSEPDLASRELTLRGAVLAAGLWRVRAASRRGV